MKNTILTIAATALLTIPTITIAADNKPEGDRPKRPGGPGGEGRWGSPEDRLRFMTEKLGLNQEQQEKIKAIYAKNADAMKAYRDKGRENLTDEDKEKVRELMKTQMEEVTAVLTPEQQEKMKEMRPRRGGPDGERRGGPGGKPEKKD